MPAPSSIAIIAALPRELSSLSRDLRARPQSTRNNVSVHNAAVSSASPAQVILAAGGMGAARVSLAVAAALAAAPGTAPVGTLVSAGFAGACDPRLQPGEAMQASLVIDSRTGERFSIRPLSLLPDVGPRVLASSHAIAGPAEKERLWRSYGAAAVDMEAAAVARIALAHGLEFLAIKAISDGASDDLTPLNAFGGPRGEFRTAAFALHTAMRPGQWRIAARLGRNSNAALSSLTAALLCLIRARETGLASIA